MSAPTEPSVTAEENAKRLATIACEIARLYAIDEKYALDMLLRGREATRAAELAAEKRGMLRAAEMIERQEDPKANAISQALTILGNEWKRQRAIEIRAAAEEVGK